jgi:hypothetical protein
VTVIATINTVFFVNVRNASKGSQNREAEDEIVEFENLSHATDAMQSVVESFKRFTLSAMPIDMKSVMHTTSKYVSNLVILR